MATITESRKQELKTWVFKVFDIHWKELAPKSNSRAQFLKYALRDNHPDDELKRIELAIKAQTVHWRKQNKIDRVIGIPTLSVWYNQQRYDDEFIDESAMEMSQREALKKCSFEGCNDDVHGSMFTECSFHLGNKDERLRQAFIRTGLDIKSSTFVQDCRQHCRERMNILMGKTA